MAGTLDPQATRKDRESRGGEIYTFKEGQTLVYFCPPCRDTDRLNYLEVGVHYGIRRGPTLCLDTRNKLFRNPTFMELLKADGLKAPGFCAGCKKVDNLYRAAKSEADKKEARKFKYSDRFLWNIIPMAFRAGEGEDWKMLEPEVHPTMTGEQVWDEVTKIIVEEGNITDPQAAIFIKIGREGKDIQTRYTVSVDTDSIRNPKVMPKVVRARISKALVVGGSGDLYKIARQWFVTPEEMQDLLIASEFSTSQDEPPAPAPEGRAEGGQNPECFGIDFNPADSECKACKLAARCKAELTGEQPPAGAPAPAPPKPGRAAAPPPPSDPEPEAGGGDEDFEREMERLKEDIEKGKGKGRK